MSLIQISNLSFAYNGGTHNVFDSASLQIDTDWKLGLIGRNGTGKTTLLRLLLGQYEYSGVISSSVELEYFPFCVPAKRASTVQVAQSISPDHEPWQLSRELAWLDVGKDVLDRPFSTLSNGEQTKVLLATLFLKQGRFMLIDEPTNHLDRHGRMLVSAYLRKKKGFILVSHDRAFLDNCIDHVVAINKAGIEVQQGNYSRWKQNRDYADSFELALQDKLKKDVKHLAQAARQAADWSGQVEKTKFGQGPVDRGFIGHKAAKMMKRAKSLENRKQQALEEKSGLLQNLETPESLKIWPLSHHSQSLVEAVDLSLWYEPGRPVVSGISFRLQQGERLALNGKNGSGKSSLLQLVAGAEIGHGGHFRRASELVVSYVPQDLSGLVGSPEVYARQCGLDENLFRAILSRLDVSKLLWQQDMRCFSDGQRKKVALARSLSEQAHLYVWDEPLNFMDVIAREQIEELLIAYKPTMIFVEHDQAFVDNVATKKVELTV